MEAERGRVGRRGRQLQGLEPFTPGAPLHNHLVVVSTDGVNAFAFGIVKRVGVGSFTGPLWFDVRETLAPLARGKEVKNGEGTRLGRLCEKIAGEEQGVFPWVI